MRYGMPHVAAIKALRAATPYLRLYRGKIFVIKTNAEAAGDGTIMRGLIEQVAILHHLGIRVALVDGGRSQSSNLLDVCRQHGVEALGPPAGAIGSDALSQQLKAGRMPVLGTLPDADADAFAATIAGRLAAEKLIICIGAPGILESRDDPHSLASYLDLEGLRRLERGGALKGEGLPSAAAIRAALKGGVQRVHVISHHAPDSILVEVFTNEGGGTLIVTDMNALTLAEMNPLAAAS